MEAQNIISDEQMVEESKRIFEETFGESVDWEPKKRDIEKRKNKVRNIPCPICGSGKKFKKCCW